MTRHFEISPPVRRQGQALRRSVLFGTSPKRRAPIEKLLDRDRFVASFAEDLSPDADLTGYDMICPLNNSDYAYFQSAVATGRCGGNALLAPDALVHGRLRDKRAFTSWMHCLGFSALVPVWDMRQGFPCVVKPAIGNFGNGVEIAWSAEMLSDILQRVGPKAVIQPLISGAVEYATHVLAVGGRIADLWTVEYAMPGAACVKGITTAPVADSWIPTPCLPQVEAVIAALGYTGTCCIDYKMLAGQPQIFEINPRVGGSLVGRLNAYLEAYHAALSASSVAAFPVTPPAAAVLQGSAP